MGNTNKEKRTRIVIENDIKVNAMIIRWLKRAISKAEDEKMVKEQQMWDARGELERLEAACEIAREEAKKSEQEYIASVRKVENFMQKYNISLAKKKELTGKWFL